MIRMDPYVNFRFRLEIDGIEQAGFSEVTGLDSQIQVIEYREGIEVAAVRKLPGLVKYSNIVLKRGLTDSTELYKWHRTGLAGKIARRNGAIILLDEEGHEKLRWVFREAWPVRWEGPSLHGEGNEVAIETLELAHEGLELV